MPEETSKASKPLIIIGALVLLLMASAFIPARWLGVQPQKSGYTPIDFSKLNAVESYAHDIDGSGQISWKELIGSTEYGPEAIAEAESLKPDPKEIAALNDPNNLTASFSKNFYIASTYLTNNNVEDPSAQQSVLNQLIEEEAGKLTPTTFTFSDLSTTKTETKESIRTYGNSVATILDGVLTKESLTAVFGGMEHFIETNDAASLVPITKESERIHTKLQKLRELSIPLSAATYHIQVLNGVAEYADMLQNLSQAKTDPLRATLAFKNYTETSAGVLRVYSRLSPYFDIKKVVFSSKDPGYVFTVGYTPQ